jgi:hypothetical protein
MHEKINGTRLCRPAFLTNSHRGLEPRTNPSPRMTWKPVESSKKILSAVEAMPRLAASLGLSMATSPDATVEILPGSPTTIAFTAGGKLKGLFVLPVTEEEARRTLGIPTVTTRDLGADTWFEEAREQDLQPQDELLADAESWGL